MRYTITGGTADVGPDGKITINATGAIAPTPVPVPPAPVPVPAPAPVPPAPAPIPGALWEPPAQLLRVDQLAPLPAVSRATLVAPAVGQTVLDPNLSRLHLRRISAAGGPTYNQLQALSAADDRIILVEKNVGYSVQPFPTGARTPISGAMPRWHKDSLIVFDATLVPPTIESIDKAGKVTRIWSGPPDFKYHKDAPMLEQISETGWTIAWVTDGIRHKLIPVNVETGQTGFVFTIDDFWQPVGPGIPDQYGKTLPNWVAASPSGKYVAIAWSGEGKGRCFGHEIFDLHTGAFIRHCYDGRQHGDQFQLSDGREGYLTVDYSTSDPTLHFYEGPAKQILRKMPWGSFAAASCRGPAGWALITGYDLAAQLPATQPYGGQNELYLMRLEGAAAGEIVRLCHHHVPGLEAEYFNMAKATWSRSGRYVVWTDTFGGPAGFCMAVELI